MEFGIIRMALKDFMFLPCIMVIFSIASFWLNILYAKVSVKNIRRGVWEGGNIFRKTGIVLLFIEAIIGEDIPENSCAVHSCIHPICIVFVVFHSPRLVYYQHSSKNLKWWPVWATVAISMPMPIRSFQKVSWGYSTHRPMWPCESLGLAFLRMLMEIPRTMHLLHDLLSPGTHPCVRFCGILYWDLPK